jgi:hypothetical protein
MIITYPTGFYESVLPAKSSDPGNITYTCSNGPPPRSNLSFPQLTLAIAIRKRPSPISKANRPSPGLLAISVTAAGKSGSMNGAKQFEPGQVLEFTDTQPAELAQATVSSKTIVNHNLNVLDLTAMELSTEVQATVTTNAKTAFATLTADLNELRAQRFSLENQLVDSQKQLNELNKAIAAINVVIAVVSSSDLTSTRNDLIARAAAVTTSINAAVVAANVVAVNIDATESQLLSVSQLVK